MLVALIGALALAGATPLQAEPAELPPFWAAREITIPTTDGAPKVRIGVWDSGVDLSLFEDRIAVDSAGRPLVRGYDEFKKRADTPTAPLPESMLRRRDELNRTLMAFDDLDSGVDSEAATAMEAKLKALNKEAKKALFAEIGAWSGYAHGTNIADIVTRGNGEAEIVVARMEWWHGSPPVPCWSKELADREAASMRDLLDFLVQSGARVVNMSWGRFEQSYRSNLEECAPAMPVDDRNALARYTVEKIRAELQAGMATAPQVLFVGAAGNGGSSVEAENPATRFLASNLILVGAVDGSGAVADYTNSGPEVTIYANGYRVPARLPGGQVSHGSGTSMAAPNVTNTAAKILAVNPVLSGAELKALIEATADRNSTGQPLLHPAKAVEAARSRLRS